MPWKILIRVFACMGMVWCLALPWASANAPKVRVGMGLFKPPYIMESDKEGLEYEIADRALAAAGYKMVGVHVPPARGLYMQRAGQLDGLLTVDEGIGGKDFFSAPYITYQNVAITLASRNIQLKNIEDLSSYSVAAFQNANVILGERFKAVAEKHPNYREYAQQVIQNNMLYSGHVDVVVGDRRIFRYFSTRLDPSINASQPLSIHTIFPPNPRKAVFRDEKLRDRFNAGLKTIQANGVYDGIMKKYAGFLQP
ncbi:MAG: ABC transporter substrate-binding protein [Rhodoferax sp.]|nr:ABC transporter substrate-binding protein [Rhodoferax sp.]